MNIDKESCDKAKLAVATAVSANVTRLQLDESKKFLEDFIKSVESEFLIKKSQAFVTNRNENQDRGWG